MAGNVLDKIEKLPLIVKGSVLAVLALAIILTFHFQYWKPLEMQKQDLEAKLSQLEQKYREQKAVADDLATFQKNTKDLEEKLRVALTQLPREKEIPQLLRDIYTLGKKSGVEFKLFQPGNEQPKRLYAELPIKLQLSGSYHEVAVFFDRIGKLSRIVNVSDIDLGGVNTKDKDITLSIACTATTFMFMGSGS